MAGGGGGVAAGEELAAYAEAVAGDGDMAAAISALRRSVGDAGWVDAAGVAATFNAIDRVADAIGIPLEPRKAEVSADFRSELEIDAWADGRV